MDPTETGLLDSTHIRFFTEVTLANLFERTGWEVVARDDHSVIRSDQYDPELAGALPVETVGMLRVLATAENANADVQQFVWALRPVGTMTPPTTYLDAVGLTDTQRDRLPADERWAVDNFLDSVGILASEAKRRSVERSLRAGPPPERSAVTLKQFVLLQATKNPRRARAFPTGPRLAR